MATAVASAPFQNGDCYKYQWARYVAQKTLQDDHDALKNLISSLPEFNSPFLKNELNGLPVSVNDSIPELSRECGKLTGGGITPPAKDNFKIAIVGAGASGLFTALLFDWLNEQNGVKGKLRIDYDIYEAADEIRGVGGRLYTHSFSDKDRDYYDVGAMRFPDNDIMTRTFRLFEFLGLKKNKKGGLLPYYLKDYQNVCPAYFNDIQTTGDIYAKGSSLDPYQLNKDLPKGQKIPDCLTKVAPSDLSSKALATIINPIRTQLDKQRTSGIQEFPHKDPLWETLMKMDSMSVRQFFSSKKNSGNLPDGPGYNFNTIEWIECATYGTGWYDKSLTECVLEELDFTTSETENKWWCVDGGAQKIAKLMAQKIKTPTGIQMNSQIVGINANIPQRVRPLEYVPITISVSQNNVTTAKDYFAVYNSTTLAALQRMSLQNAGLHWGTKQAIRALGYGASCKVAIYFNSPWWQLAPYNINKGGLAHTDLPLRVCVYPSYNIQDDGLNPEWDPKAPAVLLCSYTWGQDAQRLGALITEDSPIGEDQLKHVLLHNLALLHTKNDKEYNKLLERLKNEEYQTHHAYDWYKDQNMSGAFAYFGPSQFSNMWQEILKPQSFGQLYLVGEAASAHHAWVVGALESVIRAAYLMFKGLSQRYPDFKPYDTAMNLLKDPHDEVEDENKLPFYPLPLEMPDSECKCKAPKSGEKKSEPEWTYADLVATLSQIESVFDTDLLDHWKKI